MMKNLYKLIIFILLFSYTGICAEAHIRPDEISVSDYSGIISDGVKTYIKEKNALLFEKAKAKIIIVTSDTTNGTDANEYARSLFSSWNINRLGRGNSIFVLISPKSDDYAIIQGKNIRRALNDSELYGFIASDFEPYYSNGDYNEAIFRLYNRIGRWYEEKYEGLLLGLDDNYEIHNKGNKIKDIDKDPMKIWVWVAVAVALIMIMIFFRIKREVDFKARQQERRIKRKRSKADLDKIVNS